jgi:circadian clock protein KaiB
MVKSRNKRVTKKNSPAWELRLYVADTTPRSVLAEGNLPSLCQQYLRGQYHLTIIDRVKQPRMARQDEILATPMLARVFPDSEKSVVYSLSNSERVLRALELGYEPETLASLFARAAPNVGSA